MSNFDPSLYFYCYRLLGANILNTNIFENPSYYSATILAWIIYGFLVPALLWNYAKQDSVVAVLNYKKAIYIAGNYTGKYIKNNIIFVVFNAFFSFIFSTVFNLLSLKAFNFNEPFMVLTILLLETTIYITYIYCTFVNAYLLGTIAPPSEG